MVALEIHCPGGSMTIGVTSNLFSVCTGGSKDNTGVCAPYSRYKLLIEIYASFLNGYPFPLFLRKKIVVAKVGVPKD